MHKYLFVFIVLLAGAFPLAAQKKGKAEIVADIRIANLVETNVLFNQKVKTISGYRILIASLSGNNSKNAAYGIKTKFLSENENTGAYFCFEEPNFKVKVGDFKTSLEAFAFLQKIKTTYPNAYIIKDNIFPFKMDTTDILPDDIDD